MLFEPYPEDAEAARELLGREAYQGLTVSYGRDQMYVEKVGRGVALALDIQLTEEYVLPHAQNVVLQRELTVLATGTQSRNENPTGVLISVWPGAARFAVPLRSGEIAMPAVLDTLETTAKLLTEYWRLPRQARIYVYKLSPKPPMIFEPFGGIFDEFEYEREVSEGVAAGRATFVICPFTALHRVFIQPPEAADPKLTELPEL